MIKLRVSNLADMADLPKDKSFDPRIQTEDIAFHADEMNSCSKCSRMNPPNRTACLYCATALTIKPELSGTVKPTLRKLEAWEPGHNVIARRSSERAEIAKAALYLGTETSGLRKTIEAGIPLPIARVATETDAETVAVAMRSFGIDCFTVSDAALDAKHFPVRLSALDLSSSGIGLIDFNTRNATQLAATDLALIVVGALMSSKTDTIEKKGRGRKTKLIDETSTAADESVIDLYGCDSSTGYRIHPAGFDFSCLGKDKGMLAAENMRRLIVVLKDYFPNAKLVADYMKVRHLLDDIWEIESRKDPQGLTRAGFGKQEFGTVASTNNLDQFTKYSRLQWHLI